LWYKENQKKSRFSETQGQYPLKTAQKSDLNLKLNPRDAEKSRGDEVPSKSKSAIKNHQKNNSKGITKYKL
jgi:hypothetical protein